MAEGGESLLLRYPLYQTVKIRRAKRSQKIVEFLPPNMEIIEIKEKDRWDSFAKEGKFSFLQSWQWGEFQKRAGFEVLRLAVGEGRDLFEAAQVIKYPLPFGKNYYYFPRCNFFNPERLKYFLDYLAKDRRSVFARLEPDFEDGAGWENLIKNIGLKKSVKSFQPNETAILNIAGSPDDILAAMKPKTRYNIRLAGKNGVNARVGKGAEDFEVFWRLAEETSRRDGFFLHSRSYYRKLLDGSDGDFENILLIAGFPGQDLAVGVINFFQNRATYLYGGSGGKHREAMAPYLLQWRAILEAKKRGCLSYDFYGISEDKWPGITRFKLGFGGEIVKYAGSWDYVLRPIWYAAYKFGRKIL